MNLTKEEKTVRNILINVASKKQLIYYSDLCKTANLRLDMSIPADRGKIGEILGHISRYEHENGRPLISSVVVSRSMEQGDGFFKCKHSVNHVFSSPTSIINFTSKKPSYDDTRRSGRDNELLQRAQNDL